MISPVKKRIFCPKTTKFGPKLAFLVDMGQAMQVFLVPCWLVGWWLWRAGCISQDTYLLYICNFCICICVVRTLEWSTVKSADKSSRWQLSCFILYLCFNICLCSFRTCICICIVRTLEWTTVKSADKSSRWPRSCFILRHCPLIILSQFLSADGFYQNQF